MYYIINDMTGFSDGDKFQSESEVREYFTTENMVSMFGDEAETLTRYQLETMSNIVIENSWHMNERN